MKTERLEQAYNFDLSPEELDKLSQSDVQKIKRYMAARTVSNNVMETDYSEALILKKQEFKTLLQDASFVNAVEEPKVSTKELPKNKFKYTALIIILGLGLITAFFFYQSNQSSKANNVQNEIELFADNIINIDYVQKIERDEATVKSELLEFFQAKDYDALLAALEKEKLNDDNHNLLKAYSYLKLGKVTLADQQIDSIDVTNVLQPDLYYWIAVWIKVEQEKHNEAENLLEQLINNEYPSSGKAREIKEKL
jgi:hypothetical protein